MVVDIKSKNPLNNQLLGLFIHIRNTSTPYYFWKRFSFLELVMVISSYEQRVQTLDSRKLKRLFNVRT